MNTYVLIIEGIILLLLLSMSAFFSGSETAFFSLNAMQLQRVKSRYPRHAAWISLQIRNPSRLLSTLLIGNTLVNIAVSNIGYSLIDAIPGIGHYSAVISIVVVTIVLLIFGEVAPKRYAIVHAERLLPICTPVVRCGRGGRGPREVGSTTPP